MSTGRFEIRFDNATLIGEAAGFGLPVVFLHTGVTDRRMWAEQMKVVADAGYYVISYDRRGFGESEAPDEPFSHLADLEAVLDQLGLHAVVLVGNSMGGELAINFAIEHPERTIGLVLVGTAISGSPDAELPEEAEVVLDARAYAEEKRQWASVNRIDAHLWLDGPTSQSGRVDGPPRELFLEMNRQRLEKPKLTQEEEPEDAIDHVGAITAPVLLVVGDLDFPHILERHEDLSEEMETAFSVTLEGTAHLPSLERPDLFDPLLLEFLEAVSGGGDEDEDDEE
ncbi:MAG TPA: alpha/beta hydrolase [Devosiaceae bacterium]|jgi:pimeloyl-ACP methyl ester carboxylesterase|nr:alpha/beta hydrolase [Devosiaceae bacterium]